MHMPTTSHTQDSTRLPHHCEKILMRRSRVAVRNDSPCLVEAADVLVRMCPRRHGSNYMPVHLTLVISHRNQDLYIGDTGLYGNLNEVNDETIIFNF